MALDPSIPRDPPAERLLAVLGIDPVLEQGRRIRITQEMRRQADRIPATIRKEIRTFLTRNELADEQPLPEFKWKQALETLTSIDPPERITNVAAAFQDGDEAAGLIVLAGKAIKFLKGILPARTRITGAWRESIQPNDLTLYRFRRAYAVIQAPLSLLAEMNEGCLCRDQVRVLQFIYPSIYDDFDRTLFLELAELKAQRPRFELPRAKMRMMENLWLTRSWTPELAQAMQDAFGKQGQSQAQPQQKRSLGDKSADAAATPVQRIEAK